MSNQSMTVLRVISDELYESLKRRNLLTTEPSVVEEQKEETDTVPELNNFLTASNDKHECKHISGWISFEDKFKTFK